MITIKKVNGKKIVMTNKEFHEKVERASAMEWLELIKC